MKANELMIGDWVRMKLTFGTQWYVEKVGRISPTIELEYEPIPLTEEILKANGFRFMDSEILVFVPDDGGFISYQTVTHCVSVGCDGSVKKNIGSVHELQHALRLCGLTELADNFKIN